MYQRAEARIDPDALRHNCGVLRGIAGSGVELCPVLKADGYGHGAIEAARAVSAAGVDRIAIATAREAVQISELGLGTPLLVLGALAPSEIDPAISSGAELSAWHPGFVEALSARAGASGQEVGVHVKYDTGMGRLGTADPALVLEVARRVAASPGLRLEALWTHFATADEEDRAYMDLQLGRIESLAREMRTEFPGIRVHAANSAAMIADPRTHLDMVRPGVAVYGMDPFGKDAAGHRLRPALTLRSYIAGVKRFEPGMSAGYGRTWRAARPTEVATVPVGYGDGVRRGLSNRGQVLIRGNRFPIAGTVSMDNITIDLGLDSGVDIGDEVVLIGSQAGESITAEEVATTLGTINYEITCGISPRVPRVAVAGGA